MKYKKGDKVQVRKDLKDGDCDPILFIEKMEKYRGKKAIIVEVIQSSFYTYDQYYKLDVDKGEWKWTDEMLEPVKETPKKVKPKATKKTIKHIINGNETIVLIKNNDGTYSKGESRKHEEDEYSEFEGLRVALCRAYGVDPFEEDSDVQENITDKEKLFSQFLKGELVINCETKEESETFLRYCYNNKIRSANTMSLKYGDCCYRISKTFGLAWDEKSYYKNVGYEIITYKEFVKHKDLKPKTLAEYSIDEILSELRLRTKQYNEY